MAVSMNVSTRAAAARLAPVRGALRRMGGRGAGAAPAPGRSQALRTQRQRLPVCTSSEASTEASTASNEVRPLPSRYSVTLSKPLGVVLEEKNQSIYVGEVVQGGNAERSGLISAGDVLISTSGYVYTKENEYQGNMVRSGETLVTMNVKGESFDTVMAAIGSHPGHVQVQLEFERP
mmetsp:Transcript_20526/g.53694  ORF Transcript_20526/g.53694 Transcript_20526/m.53694 type:complete len:177 (-) Transcript_20526:974-1504(-)